MRLLKFVKIGVLAAVGSLALTANASAWVCDLTAVNSVCGPTASSPDSLTINTTYGGNWLRPTSVLQGRLLKFGAQVDF